MFRTVLLIVGMRDSGCREVVVEALTIVGGVSEVDVSLFTARATVVHGPACTPEHLVRAVAQVGYRAAVAAHGSAGSIPDRRRT